MFLLCVFVPVSSLTDNRIESLIQKADQVLNSLSQSSGGAESLADPGEARNHLRRKVISSKANVG